MKRPSFFSTEAGKLSIAGIVILLAFPLILVGVNSGPMALAYVGLAMILLSLASAPVLAFAENCKAKKAKE